MNYLLVALLYKLWFALGRVPLISLSVYFSFCLFVCFAVFLLKTQLGALRIRKGSFWVVVIELAVLDHFL